jgi:hypothetical protein
LNYIEKKEGPLTSLQKYVKYYDDNIFFTHNLYEPNSGILPWGFTTKEGLPIDDETRISRAVILVDKEKQKPYVILGSTKDVDHVFYEMKHKNAEDKPLDYYIYNLSSNTLEHHNTEWCSYSANLQHQIARGIVQAKLLTGGFNLLNPKSNDSPEIKKQFKIFKEWLTEKQDKKLLSISQLEQNLTRYLKNVQTSLIQDYQSSTMATAIKWCKEIASARYAPKSVSERS